MPKTAVWGGVTAVGTWGVGPGVWPMGYLWGLRTSLWGMGYLWHGVETYGVPMGWPVGTWWGMETSGDLCRHGGRYVVWCGGRWGVGMEAW